MIPDLWYILLYLWYLTLNTQEEIWNLFQRWSNGFLSILTSSWSFFVQDRKMCQITRILFSLITYRPGNNACLCGSVNQSYDTFCESTGVLDIAIRIKDVLNSITIHILLLIYKLFMRKWGSKHPLKPSETILEHSSLALALGSTSATPPTLKTSASLQEFGV